MEISMKLELVIIPSRYDFWNYLYLYNGKLSAEYCRLFSKGRKDRRGLIFRNKG
jgi:hypothetical protein